jgi:hypothetical protein
MAFLKYQERIRMSPSKPTKSSIHLRSVSGPVELRLLDHQFQTVAVGYGEIKQDLPPGLYRLEVNAGATQTREYLSVEPGEHFEKLDISVPFASAAPIPGTRTSDDVHGYQAATLSRQPKRSYGKGGRLVLFFRNVDKEVDSSINVEPFSLHDDSFRPVGNLPEDVVRNDTEGWAAISANMKPGGYLLRNSKRSRYSWSSPEPHGESVDLSIWISKGWTTILFIPTWKGRKAPSLRNSSVYMAELRQGFAYAGLTHDAYCREVGLASELALLGLRQSRPMVSSDLLRLLENKKFRNPMLGIIGAHALLLESQPRWSLFDTVLRNLKKLVPDHPDVTALHILGKQFRNKDTRSLVKPVSWPPILYRSYRALIARDADEPGLIEDSTPADQIASHLIPDGPWTTWKSFELTSLDSVPSLNVPASDALERTNMLPDKFADLLKAAEVDSPKTVGELDHPEVIQVAQYVQGPGRAATDQAVETPSGPVQLKELSKNVGLPVSSVKRAIRTLSEKGFPNLEE